MADNTELNAGSGGDTISTDDLGAVKVQRVKVQYGTDGNATDVSDTNPMPIDDAGGSITVDNGGTFAVQAAQSGSWTVALGATDNAVLDTIAAATGATQTAVEGTLTVDATGQGDVPITLDGEAVTISGTVTVDLGGNNDVTIDGSSIVHAEDSAHQSGDDGVMLLGVRQDSQSDFGADGDYVPLSIDANGAVRVSGGGGGTQYAEDDAHQSGDTGTMALAVRNDTLAALGSTDGDYAPLQVDANGALYVNVAEFDNGQVDDAAFTAGTDQCSVIGGIVTSDSVDSGDAGAVAMTTDRRLHTQADGAETEDAAVAGNPMLMGGRYDSSARTLDDGDAGAVALNASGHMLVEISAGAGSGGTSAADDADFVAGTTSGTPAMGVYESSPSSVTDGDMGHVGITATRQLRASAAQEGSWTVTANAGTNLNTSALLTSANFAAAFGTAGSADAQVMSVQGIASMTPILVDATGQGDVPITLDGEAITANLGATDNAVLDSIASNTAKGASHYRNVDANAEAEIKGSAGTLHWIHAINLTDSIAYLHLYDQVAASVTPGSTTPTFTFPIPTTGTASQGGGFNLRMEHAFGTGITLVVTTTIDGSAGDPGTNGVMVNAGYT